MTASYETKSSAVAWGVQPDGDVGGFRYGEPATFEASSAGAADGTTIVSLGLAAYLSTNDELVGDIVECAKATNTQNEGLRAKIRRVNVALSTLYVDAFPAQVSADDSFRLLLDPSPKAVVDAAQLVSTAQVTDATRDETAATWVGSAEEGGYYLIAEETDNSAADIVRRVTAQTAAGVFTLASQLSGDTVVGDLFQIRKFPSVEGLLKVSSEGIKRMPHVGGIGSPRQAAGPRGGAGQVTLAKRGPGRTRRGLTAEAHEALRCLLTPTTNEDLSADVGCSGTSIEYGSGSPTVGTFLVSDAGDAFMVEEDDGADTITVSPAPRVDPLTGTQLRKTVTYTPRSPGAPGAALAYEQWSGSGLYELFVGVQPVPSFEGTRGQKTKISLDMKPVDFYQTTRDDSASPLERLWYPRLPTVDALASTDNRIVIGGVEVPTVSWSFAPNPQLALSQNAARPNGVDGWRITDWQPTGQLVVRLGSTMRAALTDFLNRRPQNLMIQDGTVPGFPGVLMVWCYRVVYTGADVADSEGLLQVTLPFEVVRDEDALEAGIPLFAVGIA